MSTAFPNEPTGATNLVDHPFNNFTGFTDAYNSQSGGTLGIVTDGTAPVSPSNCMRSRISANAGMGGCQLEYPFGGTYTRIFAGMTWRTNPQFQGRIVANKMFFLRGPATNGYFGMFGGPNAGTSNFYIAFGINTSGLLDANLYPNVGNATVVPGQWAKLEFYIQTSTTRSSGDGIIRWWVNGTLAGNYTNVNYCGLSGEGLNEWVWTETWDGHQDMGQSNTVEWQHYLDHLYISQGGTGSGGSGGGGGGGGGGTPQVLPAPTNLYPNGITLPYGETTFSWNAVPGAAQYAVRIHKVGDPYEPTSSLLAYTTQAGTSIVRTTAPSSQYDWWVHSVDGSGNLGPSNGALLTTSASPVPPPPNPDPPPDPPPPPPVEPPVDPPPPVVIPPVVTPPDSLPTPQILGTATVIVTIKDRQNPIKKEFFFYG